MTYTEQHDCKNDPPKENKGYLLCYLFDADEEHEIKYCEPCHCEPKLYHWCDLANPNVHGYFWGCKEHGISTFRHTNLKGIDKLKQEWYEGKVVKDRYIEDSSEIN